MPPVLQLREITRAALTLIYTGTDSGAIEKEKPGVTGRAFEPQEDNFSSCPAP
jgi:hypothetical protein